jgi:hypothetical protein
MLFSVHVDNEMEMKANGTALFTCQKEVAVCLLLLCAFCMKPIFWMLSSLQLHAVAGIAISNCSSGPVMYKCGSVGGLPVENVTSDGIVKFSH